MHDEDWMRCAIEKAYEGISRGNTPFGACVVKGGSAVACRHNEVWERCDITAHAEILAIRDACERLGTIDLSGSTLYATTEPCPMCFAAAHWARIARIVFGTSMKVAREAGFRELLIHDAVLTDLGASSIDLKGGVCVGEAEALFVAWSRRVDARVY